MLDIEKIRQLVEMMVSNDLVELSLRDGTVEVQLRRPTAQGAEIPVAPPHVATVAGAPSESKKAEPEEKFHEIRSPMVGTFYASPDPESPPFVKVGMHVDVETVVCIVEAMKVFNEIKAEVSGTVVKVLVDNAQPLEYDQPIFLVRPD